MSTSTEKAGVCKLDKFQAGFGSGVVRELNLKKNGKKLHLIKQIKYEYSYVQNIVIKHLSTMVTKVASKV